jgi:hypothetical protein
MKYVRIFLDVITSDARSIIYSFTLEDLSNLQSIRINTKSFLYENYLLQAFLPYKLCSAIPWWAGDG